MFCSEESSDTMFLTFVTFLSPVHWEATLEMIWYHLIKDRCSGDLSNKPFVLLWANYLRFSNNFFPYQMFAAEIKQHFYSVSLVIFLRRQVGDSVGKCILNYLFCLLGTGQDSLWEPYRPLKAGKWQGAEDRHHPQSPWPHPHSDWHWHWNDKGRSYQ